MQTDSGSPKHNFYRDIPPIDHLNELTNLQHYRDVPESWYIAITDVRGSTKAIHEGKYKDVNSIAAASITAALNVAPDTELPFLFGGDGASLVVPPDIADDVGQALLAVRRMAQKSFGLTLRVGMVPVADVVAGGHAVKVAKLRLSENFEHPVFIGGGMAYADDLIKAPETKLKYAVMLDGTDEPTADFSGYECRWQRIPGKHGEVISLMVKALGTTDTERTRIYRDIFQALEAIYGDPRTRHPIDVRDMQVALNVRDYKNEIAVKQERIHWGKSMLLMLLTIAGYLLWKYKENFWDEYKDRVLSTTDHEKFDDMLRMTISGDADQRQRLTDYLEGKRKSGELVYGLHRSDRLLMTCLIFDRRGRHIHFVDADDGGYALAAKQLKAQLKAPPSEATNSEVVADAVD